MAKKWIQGAVRHPGALRATAKREGYIKGNTPLSATILGKLAGSKNPTTAKRANLAKTLRSFHK